MKAKLVPLDGAPPISLAGGITVVGRSDACDARFTHKSVSKLHCVLVETDGLVLLRDFGSTNGTRVNGLRVRRAAMLPNDFLAIAGFRYKLVFGGVPDDSEERPYLPPATAPDAPDDDTGERPLDPRGPALRRNALPDELPAPPNPAGGDNMATQSF
jgi:pSer/pThr/pTyr-binding forkhead associated (FHA) protein